MRALRKSSKAAPDEDATRICAFIDLVGTKNLAAAEADLYFEVLGKFQGHLADLCNRIDGGHIYFFSDCAFFEHANSTQFLNFFFELRRSLLQDGLYFKGAILRGNLNPVAAQDYFQVKGPATSAVRRRTLSGYFFSSDAARLYSMQERMKGIGTHVDDSLRGEAGFATVSSCYIPSPPAKGVHAYKDLRFQPEDMTRGNLALLLSEFYYAKSRSRKLGRYYVAPLVLWLQSMDLRNLEVGASRDEDLVNIILNGRFDKLMGDTPSVAVIYLTLLNRVFTEQASVPDELYDAVWEFARKRRRMFRELEGIPLDILSHDARRRCITILTSSVLQTSQEYKDIVEFVRDGVAEGLLLSEIAKQLVDQRDKFERATGREVSTRAVKALVKKERIRRA